MGQPPDENDLEFAPTPPFRLICAGCGADADAPDQYFRAGHPALVPHSSHMLWSVRCLGCETVHDLTAWPVDHQRVISDFNPSDLAAMTAAAEAEGLPGRYEDLVERYRGHFDAGYERAEAWPELDLSGCEIDVAADRFSCAAMDILAASRALRQVVAGRPGLEPPGVILLGSYRCVLSFDATPQAPYPYALHLSVGNGVIPGYLPDLERHWLLSLFFTPGEVPFLLVEPGRTVPVIHYYLPAYSAELNQC
jgi:hypothetical protein